MRKSTSGFTIVELLIVIVVIGILAAITIVAYNGIQQRSKIASATTDLRNLGQQLEIFKVDNGAYPAAVTSSTFAMTDMANVLKASQLYESTRNGANNKKSFIYCINSDYSQYIVAALEPIYGNIALETGQTLYYVSSTYSGPRTLTVTTAGSNGANICKSISGNDNFLVGRWSFDTPTPSAT